jgi:excinuclease ABC subunit C
MIDSGVLVIQEALRTLDHGTIGVYRMLSHSKDILYIGKAKDLKKRVTSYTKIDHLPNRLRRMVAQTASMQFIVTKSEVEALLLESNMIKTLRPTYNILLKDDKSFPYIVITKDEFPRLMKHRGTKHHPGDYFGPFSNVEAVDETIINLQKVCKIRTCSNSFFANRKRPCLQYHIKRCTAPCVGKISKDHYDTDVKIAIQLLKGDDVLIQKTLQEKMNAASEVWDFEKAAHYRDQIKSINYIQTKQTINTDIRQDIDVIGLYSSGPYHAIQVLFYRNGRHLGNMPYLFRDWEGLDVQEQLSDFIMQFYQERPCPELILLSHSLEDASVVQDSLFHLHKKKMVIQWPQKGTKYDLIDNAIHNAKEMMKRETALDGLFQDLETTFCLKKIERIEVYDNSHLSGTFPYGVMIACTRQGFDKKTYRRFSIHLDETRDDFAMMRHVIERRFQKQDLPQPDLLLIDGGKGQVSAVLGVIRPLSIDVPVIGISKGPNRHASEEIFIQEHAPPMTFPKNHPLFHFLQKIRDEAHRFAITTHRSARAKGLIYSKLDDISGIGPKRKKQLLQYFGSVKDIAKASKDDLLKIPGIHQELAQIIFDYFHGS